VATRLRPETSDELLKHADSAMYVAKRSGHDQTIAARNKVARQSPGRGRRPDAELASVELRQEPTGG
jgi:hypothetical protein